MDEYDVVEAGTDLLLGDSKSVLKKIGLSIFEKKQFEDIFVSAGKTVAEYEKDNTEQNELRKILFCEKNMRLLANEIRKKNIFDWLKDLDRCVDNLLSTSELDSINKDRCKKHFEDIVIYEVKKLFPQRYGFYCLGDIHDNVNSLMTSVKYGNEMLYKIAELIYNDTDKQQNKTTHEDWQDKSSYTLHKWHLERVEVDGIFAHKDSYTDDIIKLTETWQKERDEYPGWYIIPYNTAVELSMYTDENGLLQKHETEDIDVMLDFAYELCWRRIKTMLPYSAYEVFHLRQIWDKYYVKIKENAGGSDKIRKWFYIGQILLSDYRESMNWNEWQSLMDILTVYQDSGNNGKVDLMIERAKACYFQLDIPSLRKELDQCDIPKECYEQRLLVIGLELECGKLEESLEKLKQLRQDLIRKLDEDNENYYLKSLEASVLQLLSICQQAYSLHKEIYEFKQMGIDEILEEIERKKEFFDWESWKNNVAKKLFNHCVDNQFEKETFELNRRTMTMCSYSRFGHAEGYQLYKVLEKLGVPFKCGCVTVISDMELPLIASIYDFNNRLGLLLLVRCSSTGTIEKLINRKFVMDLESGYIDDALEILINAIEVNVGEIIAMGNGFPEYLAGHIRENVPILLQRFSSRASERVQKKELQFIQRIMSYRNIPPRFEVTQLMDELLRQISERMKVKLLPLMMETEIVEQVTMHSRVDGSNGIDIFDCYFNKQGLDTLFEEYNVLIDEEVINWLLKDDWKSDYEWKTKVVRLKILDEYHLLSTKQHDEYVKLIWANIDEKTQLPKLTGYYLWVYETLPYIDESIPKLSVKNYFITYDIAKDSNDLYLKQLTLLCANVKLGYWNEKDVLIILNKISKYWYKIAENTANIMFEDNSRKAVYAIAAMLENCNGMISDEAREILIKLAHEMNEKGIYTKCFDIFILRDEQWERDVQENIFAMNESQSIDSLRAMEKYIKRYPDSVITSEMLEKIVKLIELRKEPGLLSAIWILHNLVYTKNTVIDTIGIERIDRLLFFLAELINYDNVAMKDIKHCIELRQACAALAFRLFDWKTVNCGKGVEKWRVICKSSDEANEVRNQWIW